MKHRIAALLALAMLMACPIAPTVSSVTVVGPSAPALKIGAIATLTATAKDASNTVLTGKTFTWISSDPSVLSVDAQGIVTAKRLGSARITATMDGKSGEANLKTYGLEVVGGTYALPDGSFGTAVSWRVRGADGNPPPADTGLTVTGPSGWRTGRPPFIVKYDDGGTWGIRWTGAYTSVPVSGTYQASITVGGEALTTTFQIDASKKVGIVSGVKLSNITTTGFDVSWTLPSGGYGFEVDLVEDPDGAAKLLLEQKATGSTARIALTLNPAKTYQIQVFASGTDVSATNAALPAQLDLSISYQSFTVPASAPDTTPPTVSLSASSTSVTANGSITLRATATDNVGVTGVEFYEGTTLLGTATSNPYTFDISFAASSNGNHVYTAKAYDATNNQGISNAVTVNVNIFPDSSQAVVAVTPKTTDLNCRNTAQFSATVTGTQNSNVTWQTSGGSITSSGAFTPPTQPGYVTITATSVANPSASGTATVNVTCNWKLVFTATVTYKYNLVTIYLRSSPDDQINSRYTVDTTQTATWNCVSFYYQTTEQQGCTVTIEGKMAGSYPWERKQNYYQSLILLYSSNEIRNASISQTLPYYGVPYYHTAVDMIRVNLSLNTIDMIGTQTNSTTGLCTPQAGSGAVCSPAFPFSTSTTSEFKYPFGVGLSSDPVEWIEEQSTSASGTAQDLPPCEGSVYDDGVDKSVTTCSQSNTGSWTLRKVFL